MHFAHITNGIIDQIVVSNQLVIDSDLLGNSWIQTSYNTRGNVHYNPSNNNPDGGTSAGFAFDIQPVSYFQRCGLSICSLLVLQQFLFPANELIIRYRKNITSGF